MEDYPIKKVPSLDRWSENFCLAGFDPVSGVDIFLHIGRWRKDVSIWRETVAIALPDGNVVAHRGFGNALTSPDGPGGGALKMRVVDDHAELQWSFEGGAWIVPADTMRQGWLIDGPRERLQFELNFKAVSPLWDISKVGHTTDFAGHGHTEQLGRVTGPIHIGGKQIDFNGVLNRDHSRGPRTFGQNRRHVWFHGVFPNGIAFQLYEVEIEGGTAFSEVAVIDQGELHEGRVELGYRIPFSNGLNHTGEVLPFQLHYERGTLNIKAVRFPTIIYGQATTPNDIYLGMNNVAAGGRAGWVEQSVEYLLDDEVLGYGHMERHIPGDWIAEE